MQRKAYIQPPVISTSAGAVHNFGMAKSKGSRINALTSKLRAFKEGMRSQTIPRVPVNMDGMVRVSGSMPSTLDRNIPHQTLSPLLCAPNDHPLFVSDEDEEAVDATQCEQLLNSSQSEALHSELAAVSTLSVGRFDGEGEDRPELPTEMNNELLRTSPNNSFFEPDTNGPKLSSSSEGSSSGSIDLSNGTKCFSDHPATTTYSLESSCEEASSGVSTRPFHQLEPFDGKPFDKLDCAPFGAIGKSNIPQDPALGEPLISKPIQRRLDKEKAKTPLQNVEAAKKSKVRPESCGNNLVFAYRKDADEVEIREIPSEESSSDMEAEVLERLVEMQDDPAADMTSDDLSNSGSVHLTHSAEYPASLSQQPVVRKHSAAGIDAKKAVGKKKQSTWGFVLNPNYKFRHDEFKRIFRNIPRSDRLIVDYSCALQRNILVQGRLYISQNWICFYACIFGVETTLSIEFKDITHITKEKTARVFPNAIQISTKDEKHFISSLNARDKTYLILSQFWKSANAQEPMSQEEMWSWIHYSYGEDLGISHEDQCYIPLSPEDKAKHMKKIELEAALSQDLEGLGTSDQAKDLPVEEGAGCDVNHRKPVTETSSEANSPSRGNSETDSDSEIKCCGHEHFAISVCDEVLNFPVDKLFQHCFSDSEVFRRFVALKKTTDVVLSAWPETPVGSVDLVRSLTYTLSLILAMTSKKAPATEKQTMYSTSKPGQIYIIDSECRTPTIPYGDSFYIVNRYCLTRVAESKSRLRITSQIVYEKNVFFKSFIEKNATSGILETYKILVDILRQESSGQGGVEQAVVPPSASTVKTDQPVSKANFIDNSQMWDHIMKTVGSVRFLSFWVLIMAVVMVVLLNRLWTRDSADSSFGSCNMYSGDQGTGDHEAIKQLQLQLQQQQIEIDKWKNELIQMIRTMDEFRQTMKDLLQRFD